MTASGPVSAMFDLTCGNAHLIFKRGWPPFLTLKFDLFKNTTFKE